MGGFCSERSAKQHAIAVMLMYSYVKDAGCPSYNKICGRNLVRDKWLTVFLNEKFRTEDQRRKPGTIKSYIYSVSLLYSF